MWAIDWGSILMVAFACFSFLVTTILTSVPGPTDQSNPPSLRNRLLGKKNFGKSNSNSSAGSESEREGKTNATMRAPAVLLTEWSGSPSDRESIARQEELRQVKLQLLSRVRIRKRRKDERYDAVPRVAPDGVVWIAIWCDPDRRNHIVLLHPDLLGH